MEQSNCQSRWCGHRILYKSNSHWESENTGIAPGAFPCMRIPFCCSSRLHCASFHSCGSNHSKPTCTPGLRHCARARTFAVSHCSAQCAFLYTRTPFHCSGRLHCAFFYSLWPIHDGPTCVSSLRCCARACIHVFSHCSIQVCICATFHHCSRVCTCACACTFVPGPLDLVAMHEF